MASTLSLTLMCRLSSELLGVAVPQGLDAESSLYEDWGIDSLQALELVIMTEQHAGLVVPRLKCRFCSPLGTPILLFSLLEKHS